MISITLNKGLNDDLANNGIRAGTKAQYLFLALFMHSLIRLNNLLMLIRLLREDEMNQEITTVAKEKEAGITVLYC